MDKYIGAKLIQAEPERNPVTKEITGYKVVYPDGYESWSPKDVFEKAYMKVDDNKNLPSGVSIGPEMVDDFIASTETITMGETITVVRCVLRNGFDIVESSSCVDPKNYDEKIGKDICMGRIKKNVERRRVPTSRNLRTLESHIRLTGNKNYKRKIQKIIDEVKAEMRN